MKRVFLLLVLSALLFLAPAVPAGAYPATSSYYGWELAGNVTASGDVFWPTEYTAAHPYYPFGTWLVVCYSGCAVVVVTDRGPYVEGREIDLSLAAAHDIGLTYAGVDEIQIYEVH